MPTKFNKKAPIKKSKKDWHVVEFFVPIKESVGVGDDFFIRGVAINETTTRNGITYVASELESAAPSFRNKPIMVDHSSDIKDIVGRTTENVNFNSVNKSIDFEGKIMDSRIKEMINDGRITDVSIGATVEDMIKDDNKGTITAVGLEGLEISLVAIPGDPGAGLANALQESFKLKEMQMNGKEVDIELNKEEEDDMEKAEDEKVEPTETPAKEIPEETTEESAKTVTNVNVDMSAVAKSIQSLTEQVSMLAKKVKEQDETPAPTETPEKDSGEDDIPEPQVKDETKGEVGSEEVETPAETEEGFVLEKADTGKGFQIYRDYSKASGKFNRLCR